MPSFKYKARNKQGNLIEATIEASTVHDVARLLMAQEITPINIAEFTPDIEIYWRNLINGKMLEA